MTIEAVIAYCKQAGFPEPGQELPAVARAREAEFSFTERELRAALEVREVLFRVGRDAALRQTLGSAEKPMDALLEIARRSGFELQRDAVSAVLRALRRPIAELDTRELDQVAGGTRNCLPEVDDEVLVAFAQGDTRSPYVIGSLWNSSDKPPK